MLQSGISIVLFEHQVVNEFLLERTHLMIKHKIEHIPKLYHSTSWNGQKCLPL